MPTLDYSTAIAPTSGKSVTLNQDFEHCLVFDFVTKSDLAAVITDTLIKKANKFWTNTLSKTIEKDGLTYLEAFKGRKNLGNGESLNYFKIQFIQSVTGTDLKGVKLLRHLQSLPIQEQHELLQALLPKNHADLKNAFRDWRHRFGTDKLETLETSSSVAAFIDNLTASASNSPAGKDAEQYNNFNLLIEFWAHGLILLPQNLRLWNIVNKWKNILDANPEVRETISRIYIVPDDYTYLDRRISFIIVYFATSTTILRSDLTIELLKSYEKLAEAVLKNQYSSPDYKPDNVKSPLSDLNSAIRSLSSAYNFENPDLEIELPSRKNFKETTGRKDVKFSWIDSEVPILTGWTEYLCLYFNENKSARVGAKITALSHFITFLGTTENPPLKPWLTTRKDHIIDVTLTNKNTFFEYLPENVSKTSKFLKTVLTAVRQFFLWLRQHLISAGKIAESEFSDPIFLADYIGERTYNNRTHRDSLPPYVISEMKEIIIKDDFAFPKTLPRSSIQTTDQLTDSRVITFYPGVSICMYILLDTPIRSHQSRWLDSGLLDAKIFNPVTRQTEYNISPYTVANRKEAALQLSRDTLRSESWLTMWVNTNKTASIDAKNIGYFIPYVSPELVELFQTQVDWTVRYLPPLTAPLSYRHYMQDVREIRKDIRLKGPEVAPLFRDPTSPGQKKPIAYTRMKKFYTVLLEEAEKRILAKYNHEIKLITTNKSGKKTWAVDLHSLRVSGITNLIEAGVPIEVVQQFVAGHKTLVMTLHYLKYSPEKLRAFIEEANRRMQDDQDFVGSKSFIQAINEFTPFLFSQSGTGVGPGFEALNMGDGILSINSDGICPGTSCSTGFVLKEGVAPSYGPVPGGKRCPLCRYWITGPAHLLGQISALNNLAYTIRKKGLELNRLNEIKLDAEDSGNHRLARELRDRVDLLNRDVELDVNEWAARYKYAEQSLTQMDAYLKAKENIIASDGTPRVPMMTGSQAMELKVTLEQAHEFFLLDQITQMSTFNPGFPNLQAELEKNQVLSKMMVANGMKPFLLSLSDEHAREAGNLLSALILQQVNAHDLDEVLKGKKAMEHYPYLAQAIEKLENASEEGGNFLPNALSALSKLMEPPETKDISDLDQNDEDLFG